MQRSACVRDSRCPVGRSRAGLVLVRPVPAESCVCSLGHRAASQFLRTAWTAGQRGAVADAGQGTHWRGLTVPLTMCVVGAVCGLY